MRMINTAARGVLGGYLAVHGAQKLFGSFSGHGLDATGQGFASIGLNPGREMAALAGAAELGGGVLTATGIAEPLGPITIAATMATASVTHRHAGALAAEGGFELPLTNLAFAALVAATGSSAYRLGPRLPGRATAIAAVGAACASALAVTKILTATPTTTDEATDAT